ncbi:MAG: class I SAM-dependent methyltransferase [Acidimicrobiales bacterium]
MRLRCHQPPGASAARPGLVVGVDASQAVVDLARRRAAEAGAGNLTFLHADAQSHPFTPASFDVAISRFGVMFFADPTAAFTNFAQALRPQGRLAFLCWQGPERNEHAALPLRVVAAHVPLPEAPVDTGPWSLAEPNTIRQVLGAAGFSEVGVEGVETKLRVGTDADDALAFYLSQPMARSCMTAADASLVQQVTGEIRAELASHQDADGIRLDSAAWLVTARR